MEDQCSTDNPCAAVQLLVQQQINDGKRVDRLEELIDSMRNRLPLWATMAFTAAGGAIGMLGTLALKH